MYILYTRGMQITPKDLKISELECVWYLVLEWASKRIPFTKTLANVDILWC